MAKNDRQVLLLTVEKLPDGLRIGLGPLLSYGEVI